MITWKNEGESVLSPTNQRIMETFTFRPATVEDASFIARQVLEALHWEMYVLPLKPEKQEAWEKLTPVCGQEGTLYSYRHCTIAQMGEKPVGLVVAYDGKEYRDLRLRTFRQLSCLAGTDVENMEDEAGCGEWYIDSVAIVPEVRGRGIGRLLLQKAISAAQEQGLCATLLVDPDNEKAHRLYETMGFQIVGKIKAFNQWFWRMHHHS